MPVRTKPTAIFVCLCVAVTSALGCGAEEEPPPGPDLSLRLEYGVVGMPLDLSCTDFGPGGVGGDIDRDVFYMAEGIGPEAELTMRITVYAAADFGAVDREILLERSYDEGFAREREVDELIVERNSRVLVVRVTGLHRESCLPCTDAPVDGCPEG